MYEKAEFDKKDILSMEKEMLGLYISGHPLDSIREKISKVSTVNTMEILQSKEDENTRIKDGLNVKYVGIITTIKKLFTKRNTEMAFATVEDLYGPCEVVIFDSVYKDARNILIEDNIIEIEGKISIRNDEYVSIVVNKVKEFSEEDVVVPKENKRKVLNVEITSLSQEKKHQLKGFIKFFNGDKNNIELQVRDNGKDLPCGNIYMTDEILTQLKELVGEENINILQI